MAWQHGAARAARQLDAGADQHLPYGHGWNLQRAGGEKLALDGECPLPFVSPTNGVDTLSVDTLSVD